MIGSKFTVAPPRPRPKIRCANFDPPSRGGWQEARELYSPIAFLSARSPFDDPGLADAETHLIKAKLVSRLQSLIEGRGLTQTQAAEIMGIGQPDVSRMLRGHFRDFSVERLMRFLTAFGCDVDIVIQEKGTKAKAETIRLAPAAE